MKKLLIAAMGVGCVAGRAQAQQLAQYSQYMNNNYLLNPAVAGTVDYIDVNISDRAQWVGLEGAPRTIYASATSALGALHTQPKRTLYDWRKGIHAVGGLLYRDQTGPSARTGLYGSYTYNLPLTRTLRLAMGAAVGMQQFSIDGSQLRFGSGYVAASQATQVPDATVGLWLYSPSFYAGVSTAQVFGNQLDLTYSASAQTVYSNRLARHYFATAGVRLPLGDDLSLVPSALVKVMSPAPAALDLNLKLKYREVLWLGGSWRVNDAAVAMLGVGLGPWGSLTYSYDATSSELAGYQGGSHEVLLNLKINKRAKSVCPDRFW